MMTAPRCEDSYPVIEYSQQSWAVSAIVISICGNSEEVRNLFKVTPGSLNPHGLIPEHAVGSSEIGSFLTQKRVQGCKRGVDMRGR